MTPEMVKRRIDAFDSSGVAKVKDFGVPITRTKKTAISSTDSDTFLIRPATGPVTGNPKTVLYVEEGSDESYLDTVSAGARVFYGSKVYTIATAEHGASLGGKSWAKFTMSETLSDVADGTSETFYFTTKPLASSAELVKTALAADVTMSDPSSSHNWTAWTDIVSWTATEAGVYGIAGAFTSFMTNVPSGDRSWIEIRLQRTRGTVTTDELTIDKGRRTWTGTSDASAELDYNFAAYVDAAAGDVYKVQSRFLSTTTSTTRRVLFRASDTNLIWTLKQVVGAKGDKGDAGGLTTEQVKGLITVQEGVENSHMRSLVLGLLTALGPVQGPTTFDSSALNTPFQVGTGPFPTDGYLKLVVDNYDPIIVDGAQLAGLSATAESATSFTSGASISYMLKSEGAPTSYGIKVGRTSGNLFLVSFDADPPGTNRISIQPLVIREDAERIIDAIEHAAGAARLDIQALRGNPVISHGNAVPATSGQKAGQPFFLKDGDDWRLKFLKPAVSAVTPNRNRVTFVSGDTGFSLIPGFLKGSASDNYNTFLYNVGRFRSGTSQNYSYKIYLREDILEAVGVSTAAGTSVDTFGAANLRFKIAGLPSGTATFYRGLFDTYAQYGGHDYLAFSSQPLPAASVADFVNGTTYRFDFLTVADIALSFKPATTVNPESWVDPLAKKQDHRITDLIDTPDSLVGQKDKVLAVKNDETGTEFVDKPEGVSDVNVATLPDESSLTASMLNQARLLRLKQEYTLHGETVRRMPNWYICVTQPLANRQTAEVTIGQDPGNSSERGWSPHSVFGIYGNLANKNVTPGLERFSIFPAGGNGSFLVTVNDNYLPSVKPGNLWVTANWGGEEHRYVLDKDNQPAAVAGSTLYKASPVSFQKLEGLAVGKTLTLKLWTNSARTTALNIRPAYVWDPMITAVNVGRKILDALPAVANYNEGQEISVWRGSGDNKKPWTYTLVGERASKKWVKSGGSPVLIGSAARVNVSRQYRAVSTGIVLGSEFEEFRIHFKAALTSNYSANFNFILDYAEWSAVTPKVAGTYLTLASDIFFNFDDTTPSEVFIFSRTSGNEVLYSSGDLNYDITSLKIYGIA